MCTYGINVIGTKAHMHKCSNLHAPILSNASGSPYVETETINVLTVCNQEGYFVNSIYDEAMG